MIVVAAAEDAGFDRGDDRRVSPTLVGASRRIERWNFEYRVH